MDHKDIAKETRGGVSSLLKQITKASEPELRVQNAKIKNKDFDSNYLTIWDKLFSFLPSKKKKIIYACLGISTQNEYDHMVIQIFQNSIFVLLRPSIILLFHIIITVFAIWLVEWILQSGTTADDSVFLGVVLWGAVIGWIIKQSLTFLKSINDYINDMIILHNRGVIFLDKEGILDLHQRPVNFDNVDSINPHSSGLLQNLFDYGLLNVQIGGDASLYYSMPYCKSPNQAALIINRQKQDYMKNREN